MQERLSNIELCRIIAILMVVFLHSDFAVFGWPRSLEQLNIPLLSGECFAIIGVNVFVLITGYFSTRPKVKSLANLAYICFFYAVLRIAFNLVMEQPLTINNFFFISRSNWFIPVYLGLVLFAPVLNAFCDSISQKQFKITLFSLLFFEFYMGYFPAKPQLGIGLTEGCSVLGFMVLYLVGRYLKMYGIPFVIHRFGFFFYVLSSILLIVSYYAVVYLGYGQYAQKILSYSNPVIIFSAVCFFAVFAKWNVPYSKIINHISKSVLAVLLVHACREAIAYLHPQYEFLFANYSGGVFVFLWIIAIITTFVFAVILDQFRIFSWNIIQKKIFK